MNLNIYTKKPNNYFSREFLKEAGRFLFKKARGPQAVNESLIRGLKELNQPFFVNKKSPKLDGSETFFINTSLDALKWAIKLKKAGKIKKLIAGPNLVVMPNHFNSIILSSEIDIILLSSEWPLRMWVNFGFKLDKKVIIWPAGVADVYNNKKLKNKIILYKKNIPEDIYLMTKKTLNNLKINYQEIIYGKFSREEYFSLLDEAKYMIYLQISESQGLSLLEAWMKNVPTFIFNYGYLEIEGKRIIGEDISAPYLINDCGEFFRTEDDLKNIIKGFNTEEKRYNPREYFIQNFTDKICAEKFLNIINL